MGADDAGDGLHGDGSFEELIGLEVRSDNSIPMGFDLGVPIRPRGDVGEGYALKAISELSHSVR